MELRIRRPPFVALSVDGEAVSSGSPLSDGCGAGDRFAFEHQRTGFPEFRWTVAR